MKIVKKGISSKLLHSVTFKNFLNLLWYVFGKVEEQLLPLLRKR